MERSIIVLMMKIMQHSYLYFVILIIILCYSLIINLVTNISGFITNNRNEYLTEVNILKEENNYLKEEIDNITKLNSFASYNYKLTRLSYRSVSDKNIFYINGGRDNNFHENYFLVNELGLVGIINKVNNTYSECSTILDANNLSIKIGEFYGTISKYQENYLVTEDFSNRDDVKLNDIVYSSELGTVKEKIKIGTVKKIDNNSIAKKIYIEPFVDFNNISYLYVIGE